MRWGLAAVAFHSWRFDGSGVYSRFVVFLGWAGASVASIPGHRRSHERAGKVFLLREWSMGYQTADCVILEGNS